MTQRVSTSSSFTFLCSLPNGIHARPASQLAETANAFVSVSSLTNLRNRVVANMKSVLAIISADIQHGDHCSVQVNGSDEQDAQAALQQFIVEVLPRCDVSLAGGTAFETSRTLPRVLRAAGINGSFGLRIGIGLGRGKVVLINGLALPRDLQFTPDPDSGQELQRLKSALCAVRDRIRDKLTHANTPAVAAILTAELAIANDISFSERLAEEVSRGRSIGQAVVDVGEFFIKLMRQSGSEYTRGRASDIREICVHVLEELYGSELRLPMVKLQEPSVIVAEALAPQQLLGLDQRYLNAIVLEHADTTSHATILARSLGIPLVVGMKNACGLFSPGQEVVVDANRGLVLSDSTAPTRQFYEREMATLKRRHGRLLRNAGGRAVTIDGRRLEVAANASSRHEVVQAFANGADSIGLFRTETSFLARTSPPSEDEQFSIYSETARIAAGRTVIIRTFDIGADKSVPYLGIAHENNPFLGYRGVRLYADHKDLLRSQLRAILRASCLGDIQIMAPMVSSLEEVLQFKAALSEAKQSLAANAAFRSDIRVGIMIEIPAVAFILDQLCQHIDFFSIGTNDLSQYFFARDRGNPKVAELSNIRHPAFLRFLKQIVDQIRDAGKWVGMCGEMAADIRCLPLLLGLGLDEISLPATQIPESKTHISRLTAAECKELVSRAIACSNVVEVDKILDRDQSLGTGQPLLSEELVLLDSPCQSKEEAIQEIVDAFYVAGRTEDRAQLEESLWAREAVYSTGLGYGFAVPHCKTEAVTEDSIGILRLHQPIDWGSVDGQPVTMVVLIALRDPSNGTRHMQIFSTLARKLMNDDFRDHLLSIKTAQEMVAYVNQQLD
jgi:multiphosphoryl transfer protein